MPLHRWSYLSVVASAVNLLSINSHVAYGHVGNAAAVFALQRLGCEVWPVHTALFSNHAGHGSFRGEMVEASAVGDLVRGIEERGVLARCDGVLSGYLGRTETGEAILEAFAKVKAANPAARYCCDPVIGDAGRGVYVRAGIPEFLRERAVPAADVLTPNQFELEHLSGGTAPTLAALLAAADALAARHPGHLGRDRGDPGRLHRSHRAGTRRAISAAHAAAARCGSRRGRCRRGAVLCALAAHGLGCRGAFARRFRDLRRAAKDRGSRRGRDAAHRCPGGAGEVEPDVLGRAGVVSPCHSGCVAGPGAERLLACVRPKACG